MTREDTTMVVVMRPGASDGDVDKVVNAISDIGGEAFVSRGRHQTIIGLVGDLAQPLEIGLRADRDGRGGDACLEAGAGDRGARPAPR